MKNTLVIFLLSCAFASCKTSNLTTTPPVKTPKVLIFGRLTVDSNKPLVKEKMLMLFEESGIGMRGVTTDDSGYFFTMVPLGKNSIIALQYKEKYEKNLPRHYVRLNLLTAGNVYYVGDITFKWTPTIEDTRWYSNLDVTSSIDHKRGEEIPVTVVENKTSIEYFKRRLPDNKKEIIPYLVRVFPKS